MEEYKTNSEIPGQKIEPESEKFSWLKYQLKDNTKGTETCSTTHGTAIGKIQTGTFYKTKTRVFPTH